jgi:hypothetical protein
VVFWLDFLDINGSALSLEGNLLPGPNKIKEYTMKMVGKMQERDGEKSAKGLRKKNTGNHSGSQGGERSI